MTRRWWPWLVVLAATGPAVVLLLSLTAPWWWIGELAIHWSGHAALAGLVVAGLLARPMPRWAGAMTLVVALGVVVQVTTLVRPRAPVPTTGDVVRVAHGNLYLYNHRDLRPQALARLQEDDPDLLILVEAIASEDRPRLGTDRWPHQVWQPQLNRKWRDSLALLSKHPILHTETLDQDGQPYLTAILDVRGQRLAVVVVHPASPATAAQSEDRLQQIPRIAATARALARTGDPVLVIGDFNCTPRSPAWRSLTEAGVVSPATTPATYPAQLGPLGIAIDHILGHGVAIAPPQAIDLPGSDHRGLTTTVALRP